MPQDMIFGARDGFAHTRLKEEDGVMYAQREQWVRPIVDYCAARRNEGLHGSSDFRLAAELPEAAIEAYCAAQGITFREWVKNPEHVKRMLNDPALSDFRIWTGKV